MDYFSLYMLAQVYLVSSVVVCSAALVSSVLFGVISLCIWSLSSTLFLLFFIFLLFGVDHCCWAFFFSKYDSSVAT